MYTSNKKMQLAVKYGAMMFCVTIERFAALAEKGRTQQCSRLSDETRALRLLRKSMRYSMAQLGRMVKLNEEINAAIAAKDAPAKAEGHCVPCMGVAVNNERGLCPECADLPMNNLPAPAALPPVKKLAGFTASDTGGAVFVCEDCGKRTRQTIAIELGTEKCLPCTVKSYAQNEHLGTTPFDGIAHTGEFSMDTCPACKAYGVWLTAEYKKGK